MREVVYFLGLVSLATAGIFSSQPQADEPAKEPRTTKTCHCQFQGEPQDDSLLTARLEGQTIYLDKLEKEVHGLEGDFNSLAKVGKQVIRSVRAEESRLDHIAGSGCDHDEFACGTTQCIGHLLVCDGHKGCQNGEDEDDTTCSNPIPVGTVLSTDWPTHEDTCTQTKPFYVEWIILFHQTYPHLPSVAHVRLIVVGKSHKNGDVETLTFTASGTYYYGRQELVINPVEGHGVTTHLMVRFFFDGTNKNIVPGEMFHEASGHVCVSFTARKH